MCFLATARTTVKKHHHDIFSSSLHVVVLLAPHHLPLGSWVSIRVEQPDQLDFHLSCPLSILMKSQLASKRHNGEALKARVRGCATSYPYQQKENGQLRYPSLSQHLYVKELSTTIINIRNIIYYYIYII